MASLRDRRSNSQYHHFIPRFILRNFSIPNPSGSSNRGKGSRGKGRNTLIHTIDLKKGILDDRPLSQEFGVMDMYREEGQQDEFEVEKRFSALESQAATIIQRAKEELKKGKTLHLIRADRDCLRKFFFLMKYRNMFFHLKYNHDTLDTYGGDDKDLLKAYMEEKGLKRPKDVWLANIRAFLSLEMDPEMKWIKTIQSTAYHYDAMMFILHAQGSYMSFCTPESPEQEFILTENSYGIFEGPVSSLIDPDSGTIRPGHSTECHNFAPITPRLMVIFRSFLLPTKIAEGTEATRTFMFDLMRKMHLRPDAARSLLEDLPVEKCRNSYSKVVGGKVVPSPGIDGHRSNDVFYFTLFPLTPRHVNLINTIFLEEGWATKTILFGSKQSTQRTICTYLRDPREGLKIVTDRDGDQRLKYLKCLERILVRLGGSVGQSVYKVVKLPKPQTHMSQHVAIAVGLDLLEKRGDLYKIYESLVKDSSATAFLHDVDQAGRMVFMLIKTDVIIRNCALRQNDKDVVKGHRQDLFTSLPVQRVWLYVKIARNLPMFDTKDFKIQKEPLVLDGLEDGVALEYREKGEHWKAQAMFYATIHERME